MRVLTRTVYHLWDKKPRDAQAIHAHHIHPGFDKIRSELTTKLQQSHYNAALLSDVAAVPGEPAALAQQLGRAPPEPARWPRSTRSGGHTGLRRRA